MPFFKESLYIDEELRQELNKVLETGNQVYIDSIMNRVFDDTVSLTESAAVSRERMRMMLLTTGTISMASNGQSYTYDYGLDEIRSLQLQPLGQMKPHLLLMIFGHGRMKEKMQQVQDQPEVCCPEKLGTTF